MNQKILSFITDGKKLLALYSEPHPKHGEGGWFVITGEVEEDETHKQAVAREILEETGLDIEEIVSLNWGSIYNWENDICKEYNFLTFVKPGRIILNEEHSKYEWLNLDEFVNLIKWDDYKELLKKVLKKALKKEKYFDKLKIVDYRK